MNQEARKPSYTIDLIRQHTLCEINFVQLLRLLPDLCSPGICHWVVHVSNKPLTDVHFDIKQRSPYTTHLRIHVSGHWGQWLTLPDLEVRLYHDVQMAEVVFSRQSERLEPLYCYPNSRMHQPNEKELWNQFLADLLRLCHQARVL